MENPEENNPLTIDSAINLLEKKIDNWRNRSGSERAVSLHRIADHVRFKTDELSKFITMEIDKLLEQTHHEIQMT